MKKQFKYSWLCILLALILIQIIPVSLYANENHIEKTEKHVLFISSYSFSWTSVPKQIEGLEKSLGSDYVLNYEFMDTKNTSYSEGYREFYDLLKYKLTTRSPYDAVVVGDDAALNFIVLYKEELFPNIPIVFEGIDNVDHAIEAAKDPNITGIAEVVDYQKNVELAHQLLPKANKLVFILDNAENGIGIQKQLDQYQEEFSQFDVEYINSSLYTQEDFCDKLETLDDSCITFCVSMSQRADGVIYTEDERYQMLNRYAHVPLFRVSVSGVGVCESILGGYVVSHYESGKLAGEIVKEALTKGDISTIEVNLNTPSEYYFNWQVMKKYHLNKKDFPADATYVNVDESYIQAHYIQIISLAAMVIILLLLVVSFTAFHGRTRLRNVNKKLDYSNRELNKRNKELLEKNIELEKVSEYKSDFLSRVSHDIRTPMNTILNLTTIVESELDDKEAARDDLKKIETSNQFLLSLVNDILDMSHIEQKNMELHSTQYGYSEFLNYIRSTFEPLSKKKNITFTITSGECDSDIVIDKVRFNQLCFNLLSNAIKYTPDGGHVEFIMKHGKIQDGILPCHIYVKDDGIGMSQEFQKKMFEAFSQEGRAFESVEGTGLGLSIVKEIVDLLGATIDVKSEENKGTTFHVYLDMVLADHPMVEQKKENTQLGDLKEKNILVVEDHPLNQEIAKRLLERVHMNVYIVDDGQKAVDAVSENIYQYDAILMDMRMPVMDGLTATKQIRELNQTRAKTIPIIAMTANAFNEDRADTEDAGMNAYLTKPIDPQVLYETLLRLL